MANEQNLTPFTNNQSREEAVKNGRKGGKASGKARRERKTIAQCINAFLDERDEASGLTRRELLAMKVVKTTFDTGSAKSLKILTEITGELKQKVELDNKNPIVLLPEGVMESIKKQAK